MKKYFLFACVAAALVSCSSDEFLGENQDLTQKVENDGAILFKAYNGKASRADKVGKDAADLLGGKFIVEGVKASAASTKFNAADMVFDDYLVQWTQNTAGTADDNTNDWAYVGLTSPTRTTAQTIKYWDYSANNYQFVAFSTGTLNAVTSTAVAGTSVQVTAIDKAHYDSNAFTLTAAGAGDLAKCYYTDVTTIAKAEYGNPVTLKFKNMAAKVRVGLYEIIPGYKVQNVKFYTSKPTSLSSTSPAVATATLFTSTSSLPTSGSITVSYDDAGKATASVTAGSTTAANMGFGAFPATAIGTTLADATFSAGDPANSEFFSAVIPANAGQALNLMCDYDLVSEDGSNETIKVYGANAVVPATYTHWLPNYAYTYIFKISQNSNGYTNPDDPHSGLFPITFDAVVKDITDATTAEQTTVTTVATPSVTTYQKGHKKGAEYAAGDIYVQVQNNATLVGDLNGTNKSYLYTLAAGKTEADVVDALQMNGRNGLVLTDATASLTTNVTTIPGADGNDITVAAGTTAKFTAAAGDYAFVYDFTPSTAPEATKVYTYVETTSAPTDWAEDTTNTYYTKNTDGTYTQVTTAWQSGVNYYKLYLNNNRSYAVKVIHVQ